MSRKSPPPAVAGKPILVTFGVNQTDKVNKAANMLNKSPRQFMLDSTMEACESTRKVPES
ncbi:hypothetical protein N018_01255 [Pseudomonas syringae CC1557]|uniref:Uncharacterized protein n=1 Tax=Pseudomonas syringae CC1557 TaxID=1357279 RepID=W0N1Z5_PSESX|nr:hypothetical protein [Pseudomonas syringae]MDU8430366.1 hypothetical protein [Pseudomonas syringae pv. actinidifoliorum]AHG43475.1 hypothetical protein N018_01255 [Pseudomonas syringae CC1557]MCH5532396.1 hypothetical protein [Pseudomonas syringae pv. syringae]MCH5541343.1 hypothetical protein [Pseudomonas syringae pv. syringae]MCH5544047.1 hypothetical protein [Pseudomonas syringae pv. syringae]